MENKKKLLIATHNQDKVDQIRNILKNTQYELVSLSDLNIDYDVDENGTTYEENAILKARTYAKLAGIPALADDSGIEIDALNGEPGIYAARYAGPNKTTKERAEFVLDKMKDVPLEKRGAQFTSVVALIDPSGNTKVYKGVQQGMISTALRGRIYKHFIYNVIFLIPEQNKTLSELKQLGVDCDQYSARGIAVHKLLKDLI